MEINGINYSIQNRSDTELLLSISFLPTYEYFQGHFDDFKLLPALIQIKTAIDFSNKFFSIDLNPKSLPKMKFTNPIKPNIELELELRWDQEKGKVHFKYFNYEKMFSMGEMNL